MRLDRFLGNLPRFSRAEVRLLLVAGRARVNTKIERNGLRDVREFDRIELDDELLQAGKAARYLMLHKPAGVVSATRHPQHRTVIDLLDVADKHELHLAGRLDINTTGLLLITNDGQWSRQLTLPQSHLPKSYLVTTAAPITKAYIELFQRGIYFAKENLTTMPAQLELLDSHRARLILHEGRHHQVKRMFAQFDNQVLELHREQIGSLTLADLPCGHWRALTVQELHALHQTLQ